MKKILIVDDLAVNRLMLRHMLSRDYEIVEAARGQDAIRVLSEQFRQISAVLLDIVMPGMDGFDVLRQMRGTSGLADMPVIMITGSEEEETRVKALALGANDFVTKPYNAEVIRHCLRNNIALRESTSIIRDLQRDRLTNLFNRDSFLLRAEEMIRAKEPGHYIMAFFDVDKFKVINDQYGTERGDELLRHIASVFQSGFEPHGGICCRITADNFAVLYPVDFVDSPEIEEIRRAAARVDGIVAPIVFSIGRYLVNDLSIKTSTMLDRAAMAAEMVKGRYDSKIAFYDDSMRAHLIREQEIVMEMESALRDRQFEVWFQPQVNHSTGSQIGSEALVRWRHPKKGLLPPAQFLPIFEENGFIYQLDQFVWNEVCALLRRWIDEGRRPLPVSVNVSRDDMFRPDVVDVICSLIDRYALSVDLLRLEITETAFAQSTRQIIDVVKQLIDRGFTVEIDDFGSGYSSLNTLKDVPAQILKLDMRFFESSNSQRGGNIVQSVVRMAKWLGMSVIAEGVETVEQANYLRSIGCGYIQGYFYAKPMPVLEFEAFCAGAGKEERLPALETVENLDNNSFWDPASMDTLIFNSYVGGACIFEFHGGQIELLRATEKFAQIIGSTGMTVEDVLKLNWTEHLDGDTRRRLWEALNASLRQKKEVVGEYVFFDLPGCPHETYLRSTMRVIATAGESCLVYCTNENITAQRQAEKREHEVAEEMRIIMANVDCGICAVERGSSGAFRVIFANDRFYGMYGYTRAQVDEELGGDIVNAVYQEDRERALSMAEKILHGGGSATYAYRCVKRGGDLITVRCTNAVISFAGFAEPVLLAVVSDVTEQVASEEKLRALAERLQLITDNMNCGISAMVMGEGGIPQTVFANDKYYSILGYTRRQMEEALPDVREVVHPDDRPGAKAAMDRLLRDRVPVTLEYRCVKPDGSVIFVSSSKSMTAIDGYGDRVVISVVSDITDRVLAQKSASRLSAQLQAVLDHVDLGIVASVLTDGAPRILLANDRFYEMRGYTREQYAREIGDSHSLVLDSQQDGVRAAMRALEASGDHSVLEYQIVRRDGAKRRIRNAISTARFDGIEQLVLLSIFRDITDEKEMEARELRSAEQFRIIMRDIDSGLTATILRGDKVELLFSNEQFYRMRGYDMDQYRREVGDYYALVHPGDRERVAEATSAVFATGRPARLEYRVSRRDGAERWIRVSLSATRFTGIEQRVVLSVYSDISAEKEAELRIREAVIQMQTMMDDMPGGFVRMVMDPDGRIRPVYINDGFCKLTGMTQDELMDVYATDALAGVHPDDVPVVRQAVAEMMEKGEARSSRYRLLLKGGGYIWLTIFGRITKNPGGQTYLSIYYTDATEQAQTEEKQRKLLDNLPYGAGLFEMSGEELTVRHLNRRYWELVGRRETRYAGEDFLSAVKESDRETVTGEIKAALREGRDAACDIRILSGSGEYRPFHVTARIGEAQGKVRPVYAVYDPISGEALSIRQMLPIALGAVMSAQTESVFVKDGKLRYVCCSEQIARLAGCSSPEEMIGKSDADFLDGEIASAFEAEDRRVLESGEPILDVVTRIPLPDGTDRYSRTSKFPLRDSAGNIVGVYGVGRDITEDRAMKTQFELLTNSIPGGIATYAYQAGEFHITYFSDGFSALFDLSREEYARIAALDVFAGICREDLPRVRAQLDDMVRSGAQADCLYRVRLRDGKIKWITLKASCFEKSEDKAVFNAVLFDVTARQEAAERIRISEEENALAIRLSGSLIARFSIPQRTLTLSHSAAETCQLPEVMEDVPEGPIRRGLISPESVDAYRGFYESLARGNRTAAVVFREKYAGDWRWVEAHGSTVFADDGKPAKAVVSLRDVTEQMEKETVYKKWDRSMRDKKPESYTLLRCNLNSDAVLTRPQGALLSFDFAGGSGGIREKMEEYARSRVFEEDRAAFCRFADADTMLAEFHRDHFSGSLEYREAYSGGVKWRKLTADLVEYPASTDVEAYLLFEDIDESKKQALRTKEQAETDSLTGVLNRAAFADAANRILRGSEPSARHAILMLDIDGFKQVNDTFGHGAGDRTLIEIAASLRGALRRGDLLARLGGDEFVIFLKDVSGESAVSEKARQICAITRKSFSVELQISASLGITMAPYDGRDFDALYRKADAALYYVKGAGKDNYAFYSDSMEEQRLEPLPDGSNTAAAVMYKKRRMLIVEDSDLDFSLLENMFRDSFIVERARDGNTALIRLRHYGAAISVVLLDLVMPGMDGFAVLDKMRQSAEMKSIPVIIVSGDSSRDSCLRAVRAGATDFVTKPVDPDVLGIRVHSAISKAENERLRVKNALLEIQSEERVRLSAALEGIPIGFAECDWLMGRDTYHPSLSRCLFGSYDARPLWQILLSDGVAGTADVQRMQRYVHSFAEDRERQSGDLSVRLRAASGEFHSFRLHVRKQTDEFGLANRFILTFEDLDMEGAD